MPCALFWAVLMVLPTPSPAHRIADIDIDAKLGDNGVEEPDGKPYKLDMFAKERPPIASKVCCVAYGTRPKEDEYPERTKDESKYFRVKCATEAWEVERLGKKVFVCPKYFAKWNWEAYARQGDCGQLAPGFYTTQLKMLPTTETCSDLIDLRYKKKTDDSGISQQPKKYTLIDDPYVQCCLPTDNESPEFYERIDGVSSIPDYCGTAQEGKSEHHAAKVMQKSVCEKHAAAKREKLAHAEDVIKCCFYTDDTLKQQITSVQAVNPGKRCPGSRTDLRYEPSCKDHGMCEERTKSALQEKKYMFQFYYDDSTKDFLMLREGCKDVDLAGKHLVDTNFPFAFGSTCCLYRYFDNSEKKTGAEWSRVGTGCETEYSERDYRYRTVWSTKVWEEDPLTLKGNKMSRCGPRL